MFVKEAAKSLCPAELWSSGKRVYRNLKKIKKRIYYSFETNCFSFNKTIKNDVLAIITPDFPHKNPLGFKNYEINGLLKEINGSEAYTMYPMYCGNGAWFNHAYGVSRQTFAKNKNSYLKFYPYNKNRIKYLYANIKYRFNLAYSYFLCETNALLPFYNKNKIPFVFVLYPGGAFGLDNNGSDIMLSDIFASPYFCGVIVTQDVTMNYLLKKKLCPENKIHFLFGGYTQFEKNEAPQKLFYPYDKKTFDICFVAAKYSKKGIDKGYDLFIECAHLLASKYKDIRFHVVGDFDESDIDVSQIIEQIKFYGRRPPDWLKNFYAKIDIQLSPNRPYKLFTGNFDGFPLGCDAMAMGSALFTTDELNNNNGRFGENQLVIIKPEITDIVKKVEFYYHHTDLLYAISRGGGGEN